MILSRENLCKKPKIRLSTKVTRLQLLLIIITA